MFDEAGLPHAARLDRVPNSRRALILGELARDRGLLGELHPRLFAAYWAEGRDIGDPDVLLQVGEEAGLDRDEMLAGLENRIYLQRVLDQTGEALGLGVSGVPAWVVDGRLLVPGAQPHDVFERVLEGLGHARLTPPSG